MNTTTNARGVSEAMVAELIAAGDFLAMNGTDGMVRRWEKAKAALSAEPAAQGEAWGYAKRHDVTKLRGLKGAALGVYLAEKQDDIYSVPVYLAPPAQPADSKVIGADLKVKQGERVPEGLALAIAHIRQKADAYAWEHCGVEWDTGATTYHHGQAGEDYHHGLLELVDELTQLAASPAAPAEEEPPTCPICDQMKLSARCSACGYEDPTPGAAHDRP